jgi:hypothetical protein
MVSYYINLIHHYSVFPLPESRKNLQTNLVGYGWADGLVKEIL